MRSKIIFWCAPYPSSFQILPCGVVIVYNINMNVSRVVDVGTPSNDFREWTTTEVRFHNYANLTTTRGEYEASPTFSCLGHEWKLVIYPGGREPLSPEGMVAVYLCNMSTKSIKIEYSYSIKDSAGK